MLVRAIKHATPIGVACFVGCGSVYADEPRKPRAACIYDQPTSKPSQSVCKDSSTELERAVQKCRQELAPLKDSISDVTSKAVTFTKDSVATVKDNVRYLRHRAPDEVRYGFMAGGGLLGLIYGMRRGFIRKLFYVSVGTAGAASIIYPKEAKGYALISFCLAKKYATIGYNFVTGVDPNNNCKVKAKDESPVSHRKAEKMEKEDCGCKVW